MIDNGNGRDFPRSQRTRDRVTGEDLLIVYYPKPGVFTINGYWVTRSIRLEDMGLKTMFLQSLGSKVYTVGTFSLTQLSS